MLTLTATPIPRTLAMSLEGIREFSVSPRAAAQLASRNSCARKPSLRAKQLRELKRGGQVFFCITKSRRSQPGLDGRLCPRNARIAHGPDAGPISSESCVTLSQRFNVLVMHDALETGIERNDRDTIITTRRQFACAAHQLRGRVGVAPKGVRVPNLPWGGLTKNAENRLEAIQILMSGALLPGMHDLEIAGAGEVIGESQSATSGWRLRL